MSEHDVHLFVPNELILLLEEDGPEVDVTPEETIETLKSHPAVKAILDRFPIDRMIGESLFRVDMAAIVRDAEEEKRRRGIPTVGSDGKAELDLGPGPRHEDWGTTALRRANVVILPVGQKANDDAMESAQPDYTALDSLITAFETELFAHNPSVLRGLHNKPIISPKDVPDPRGVKQGPILIGMTLNWHAAAAPHQIGVGGPGARPVQAYPPARPTDYAFTFSGKDANILNDADGAGTTVYVLDTLPNESRVQQFASNQWKQFPPYDSLPNKMLWPSLEEGVRRDDWHPASMIGHHYDMTDHGLFAAGIVRAIAPEAEIRFVEVLDRCGVGTLASISRGFDYVLHEFDQFDENGRGERIPRSVVNCSFTLAFPDHNHFDILPPALAAKSKSVAAFLQTLRDNPQSMQKELDVAAEALQIEPALLRDKLLAWGQTRHLLHSHPLMALTAKRIIQELTSSIYARGATLVAAAGNEGPHSTMRGKRPYPRYPAAAKPVIGVGASDVRPEDRTARAYADYSSSADDPPSDGFLTFGGKAANGEAVPNEAIRGIYTTKFSNGGEDTGWAWWAGTSFAAPIISGAIAGLLGLGKSREDAVQFLRDQIDQSSAGGAPVQVLPVTRGSTGAGGTQNSPEETPA